MNRITKCRRFLKYSLLWSLFPQRRNIYGRRLRRLSQQSRFEKAIQSSQNKTCIDLGANLGVFTKKMALQSNKVIAFEPDPWTCIELRRNLAHLDNVKIENVAAGIGDDIVLLFRHKEFMEDPYLKSQSSSVIVGHGDNAGEGIAVPQIDFIKYIEELNEDIGVLKIDIEGAEVDILEALFDRSDIMDRIDYIFAETHERFSASLEDRTRELRKRAERIVRPQIDLDWH